MNEKDELYYLFSLHDINQDGYLDGNELRDAFTEEFGSTHSMKLDEIVEMVDHVLAEDDMNNE